MDEMYTVIRIAPGDPLAVDMVWESGEDARAWVREHNAPNLPGGELRTKVLKVIHKPVTLQESWAKVVDLARQHSFECANSYAHAQITGENYVTYSCTSCGMEFGGSRLIENSR